MTREECIEAVVDLRPDKKESLVSKINFYEDVANGVDFMWLQVRNYDKIYDLFKQAAEGVKD